MYGLDYPSVDRRVNVVSVVGRKVEVPELPLLKSFRERVITEQLGNLVGYPLYLRDFTRCVEVGTRSEFSVNRTRDRSSNRTQLWTQIAHEEIPDASITREWQGSHRWVNRIKLGKYPNR
jgi:hypothetical protein